MYTVGLCSSIHAILRPLPCQSHRHTHTQSTHYAHNYIFLLYTYIADKVLLSHTTCHTVYSYTPLHLCLCAYMENTYVGLIASSLSLGELRETVGAFCVTLSILMALFRRHTDNHTEECKPNDEIALLMTTSKPRSVAQVV